MNREDQTTNRLSESWEEEDLLDHAMALGFGSGLDVASGLAAEDISGMRPSFETPDEEEIREHPAVRALEAQGRYRVDGLLGHGGMGIVLRAFDKTIGREVAVKIVRLPERHDVARFLEEARIAGRLQHPCILPVYDVGLAADREPWFSMKVVSGRTLSQRLKARSHPGENLTSYLGIMQRIAEAMAYAHDRNVIHRDLKPGNVMLGRFGEVLVMDWGLAHSLAPADGEGTEPRAAGTPSYMAPEQARGDANAGPAVDVFSLGAMLYQILTDHLLHDGGSVSERWRAAATGDLGEARQRLATCGADPDLVALTLSCLDPDPEARPENGAALSRRLAEYRQGFEARAHQAEVDLAEERARASQARMIRGLLIGVVVAITIAAAAALFALNADNERARARDRRASADAVELTRIVSRVRTRLDDIDGLAPESCLESLDSLRHEAVRAQSLVNSITESETVRHDVAALLRELDELKVRAAREAKIAAIDSERRQRLAALRQRVVDDPPLEEIDAAFLKAFEAQGLSLAKDATEAAIAAMRSSRVADVLPGAFLDHLVHWTRLGNNDADEVHRRTRIACEGDPHPERGPALRRVFDAKPAERGPVLFGAIDKLDPAAIYLFARDMGKQGRRAAAIAAYNKALELRPDSYWLHLGLGHELFPKGEHCDLEAAYRHFHVAAILAPRSVDANANVGITAVQLGRHEVGEPWLRRSLERHPLYRSWLNLGFVLRRRQDRAGARDCFAKAVALRHNDYWARLHLVDCLLRMRQLEAAREAAAEALALFPKNGAFLVKAGRIHEMLDREDDALQFFLKALEAEPGLHKAHHALGRLLYNRGEIEKGLEHLRKSVHPEPTNAGHAWSLANLLLDMKPRTLANRREAEALARAARRINPAQRDYAHFHGDALRHLLRFDDAAAILRQDLQRDHLDEKERERVKAALVKVEAEARLMNEINAVLERRLPIPDRGIRKRHYRILEKFQAWYLQARFWRRIMEEDPPTDPRALAHAARCVLRALGEDSPEAETLSAEARLAWMEDALGWFEDAIDALHEGPVGVARLKAHWRNDRTLSALGSRKFSEDPIIQQRAEKLWRRIQPTSQ